MTDDEIRVLRASEQTLRTSRVTIEQLADEALRRGEEIATTREQLDEAQVPTSTSATGPWSIARRIHFLAGFRERHRLAEADLARANDRLARLEAALHEIHTLVDRQAEDEGLWLITKTASEADLQQELRRLHKVIEQARA